VRAGGPNRRFRSTFPSVHSIRPAWTRKDADTLSAIAEVDSFLVSVPYEQIQQSFNAAEYFVDRHLQEGRGDRIAIECEDQRVTYSQLSDRVNRLGTTLRDTLDVRMEERVLLLLPDIPEFAYCFFGAIKIGAVPVPVNTLLRANEYEYLLNDTRARVAITSESLLHLIQQIPRERLGFLRSIIVVGAAPGDTLSLSELLASHSAELPPAPTCTDDVAFWLYSSGSTGFPKACIHLQHDMVIATEQYARNILNIRESDRFFSVAKLFFAYGLGNGLYFPLSVGATSILWPGPPSPQNVYDVIERYRPTLFFSVPSNYAALMDFHGKNSDFDLSSIRLGISAGEALPVSLCERFTKRFAFEILDGIGSTEALHIFVSNSPGDVRHGSSGRAVPGCEVRILDDQGQPVATNEIGTLWVQSEATCAAYWNRHQRSKQTIQGNWISTGDKFHQDSDGYYWFDGRADDMLKVSGAWVSPSEIESVLIEHSAVAEVAVVANKDKDGLTKPVAWVVLREGFIGNARLASSLQEFVVSRLPNYKRPRCVEFVSELPKTATGKIQRFKLRQASLNF
jgi:benzoate-CoA ligase family protein